MSHAFIEWTVQAPGLLEALVLFVAGIAVSALALVLMWLLMASWVAYLVMSCWLVQPIAAWVAYETDKRLNEWITA